MKLPPIALRRTELCPISVATFKVTPVSSISPKNFATSVWEAPQFPVMMVVTPMRMKFCTSGN